MARIETVETGRVTEADLPAPDVSIVVTLFNEAASVTPRVSIASVRDMTRE